MGVLGIENDIQTVIIGIGEEYPFYSAIANLWYRGLTLNALMFPARALFFFATSATVNTKSTQPCLRYN